MQAQGKVKSFIRFLMFFYRDQLCLQTVIFKARPDMASARTRGSFEIIDNQYHLTLPLASEANVPPKQRTAKMIKAVFALVKKAG